MSEPGGVSDPVQHRFGEPAKFLPVGFVVTNILGLYGIYMAFHAVPMLYDPQRHHRAVKELAIFNTITGLLVICYMHCILVHPGTIPEKDEDPTWEYLPKDSRRSSEGEGVPALQETKRSGDRRHCKWCAKYKPDRCHHCRVCRVCILKMDHHCPWIYNCVGFRNHKYFFLFIFYVAVDCNVITWTMLDSVRNSVDSNTPFMTMFFLLFGETLAAFIGMMVTAFWAFHVWLMMKSMTTIEFCEKSMKNAGYESSVYDLGFLGNIRAVLGDYTILWLLPCSPPSGPGLDFLPQDTPLNPDEEASPGSRHRQRPHYGAVKSRPLHKAKVSGTASSSSPLVGDAGGGDPRRHPRLPPKQQMPPPHRPFKFP
mmetsp:Transcript_80274/g.239059  ORF Transcript_80274/g.239059 Transcript_80274/m.239059 type:complete len:368 (-) Transcript_80274:94-1197(-)